MRIEPGGLDRFGPRGLLAPDQEVAAALADGAIGGNLHPAVERPPDDVRIDADPFRLRQQACHLGAILRLLDIFGGARQRTNKACENLGIFLRPGLPDRKHLLSRARQNVGGEMQDVADAFVDRDGIPGRADAERIDMPIGKAVHHVRRRQHDQPHVLVRIDAPGRHPEPQLVVMGGERKGHGEGQRFRAVLGALGDEARQRLCGGHRIEPVAVDFVHDRGMQRLRHRDGVAIDAEREWRCDRHLDVPEPETGSDRDRRQQMSCIQQADIELVANIRPRHFPDQGDIEPFGRGEPLVDRDDQRCGVDQRNEADVKRCHHFRSSDAVRIDCAISPIFFFSRIAVERIST